MKVIVAGTVRVPPENIETLRPHMVRQLAASRAEAASWRTVVETVFVNGIPVQQPVRKFEETEELRGAKAALADLEEEFRRTGLPAGWAR